jgi:2-keto-4-pentenoate hydratase/2-oxohepta-3-ene-1,7-dioic acid hydratase in catechol pathway
MRFLRFRHTDGTVHTGIRKGDQVCDLGYHDPLAPLENSIFRSAPVVNVDVSRLEVPLARVPKILALAGNYRKHVAESGFSGPERGVWTPQVFWKPSTALLGNGGTVALRENNHFFDWEAELAIVIGREARDVSAADAIQYVFGYAVCNDLSERKYNSCIENRDKREFDPFFDWLMGKWFDGSAPLGPELVTADEVPDPDNLNIRMLLNGELMQNSNTSQMIFKGAETIAAVSAVVTLEPGDVIMMGTPDGVGFARGRSLRSGDHLRTEIEGLGSLDTFIVEKA